MPTYKTGRGRGTKTVQAKQFRNTMDYDLAYWAGGVIHAERAGANTIRIHQKGDGPTTQVDVHRYDWIVKLEDGQIIIETAESFRDHYREVPDNTKKEGESAK